jgi:hypothetical protein
MSLAMIVVITSSGRSDGARRSILLCLKVGDFVTVMMPLLLLVVGKKQFVDPKDLEDCLIGFEGF